MDIKDLKQAINSAYKSLDIATQKNRVDELYNKMSAEGFWSNPETAQEISKQHSAIKKRVDTWEKLKKSAEELAELSDLNDQSLSEEIGQSLLVLEKQYLEVKRELQFSGVYDDHDVILSIFAGTGGTDAQDWAQMLLRMYVRYCESNHITYQTLDQSAGEEAGIKSVTLELSGKAFLYGNLKGEHGVHRLVRLSPFNADSLRQTSFAKVDILPKVDKPEEVELDEKDLKIDVFRSGGHGGQSVNTTDSAVRVTHIPTNIVVVIQNERSQLQNKETALTLLRSKLAQLQIEQHKEKISDLKGPNEQASWGNQIRNYVLHPYTMVKDTRTKHETTDAESVLNGNLQSFIDSYLDSLINK